MLDSLITSKTRLKMLLKFFINSQSSAYLRGLAEEFGESTNAIRHELNNLSKAGYLISREEGRTIVYQANTQHPLFSEVRNLVHKHLGIDKIIENVLRRLGDLQAAYIVGDYAAGKDTGTIELVLVGRIDGDYLNKIADKAKGILHRNIQMEVMDAGSYLERKNQFRNALLIWGSDANEIMETNDQLPG